MKRILFDTNVVLDVLLDRTPWVDASAAVWTSAETGVIEGLLAAHAVTTIHYLLHKEMGNDRATRVLSAILKIFAVAAVDGDVVQQALAIPLTDFEDSVTASAAQVAGCSWIVTRDPKRFRGSPVPSLTPESVIALVSQGGFGKLIP